jgi:hypothetical protein
MAEQHSAPMCRQAQARTWLAGLGRQRQHHARVSAGVCHIKGGPAGGLPADAGGWAAEKHRGAV